MLAALKSFFFGPGNDIKAFEARLVAARPAPRPTIERKAQVRRLSGDNKKAALAIGAAAIEKLGEGSSYEIDGTVPGSMSILIRAAQYTTEIFTCELRLDFDKNELAIAEFGATLDEHTPAAARRLVKNLVRYIGKEGFTKITVSTVDEFTLFWGTLGFRPTSGWMLSNEGQVWHAINHFKMRGKLFHADLDERINRGDADAFRQLSIITSVDYRTNLSLAYVDRTFFERFPRWEGELIVGDVEGVEALFETSLERSEDPKSKR